MEKLDSITIPYTVISILTISYRIHREFVLALIEITVENTKYCMLIINGFLDKKKYLY